MAYCAAWVSSPAAGAQTLGEDDAVILVDESGMPKQGQHSAIVKQNGILLYKDTFFSRFQPWPNIYACGTG
jgi:hypothetical protein